jgi:hypothetical protein
MREEENLTRGTLFTTQNHPKLIFGQKNIKSITIPASIFLIPHKANKSFISFLSSSKKSIPNLDLNGECKPILFFLHF